MKHIITYLFGIVTGMYLYAQTQAIHMPVFRLPKNIHIDPVAIGLMLVFILSVMAARKKRPTPRFKGTRK